MALVQVGQLRGGGAEVTVSRSPPFAIDQVVTGIVSKSPIDTDKIRTKSDNTDPALTKNRVIRLRNQTW
jgi:hypothetical protein